MATDFITTEQFMGISVRIVEHENQYRMIPLNDIADGISYDRSTLRKLFRRNERLLGKYAGKVIMTSPQGAQETLCLNRDGVNGLLMKLDLDRIKNPEKQERILKFQDWAIETLGKVMDNKIDAIKPFAKPSVATASIGERVTEQLQIADAMSKYANVDRGIAASMALSKVEFETGADLKMWKNLLGKEKTNKNIGILTATEIGKELGLGNHSGASVNKILYKLGFLEWLSDHWVLTEKGTVYAEVFPVTGISVKSGKSYSRYQIKWEPKIVKMLHDHIFGVMPDVKNGLITGYI